MRGHVHCVSIACIWRVKTQIICVDYYNVNILLQCGYSTPTSSGGAVHSLVSNALLPYFDQNLHTSTFSNYSVTYFPTKPNPTLRIIAIFFPKSNSNEINVRHPIASSLRISPPHHASLPLPSPYHLPPKPQNLQRMHALHSTP